MPMKVYELKAEDLTGLGSPMGSERVNVSFTLLCKSLEVARRLAYKDYGGSVVFHRESVTKWSSGDLGHVRYSIERKEVLE